MSPTIKVWQVAARAFLTTFQKERKVYKDAYSTYKKAQVTTASQGHLVVLLYEGAVKNLNKALSYFDGNELAVKDIEPFSKAIQKTQSIIGELQVSLNMEVGGDISKNLMALYIYFNNELMDANIKHDKTKLTTIRDMISDMTDAWRKASMTAANTQTSTTAQSALDING